MIFAESEPSSAFWVAIIVAIGGVLSTIFNSWLQYKQNVKTKALKEELQANTQLTQETKREVNGKMAQLLEEAKSRAHAEGVLAGKAEAKRNSE